MLEHFKCSPACAIEDFEIFALGFGHFGRSRDASVQCWNSVFTLSWTDACVFERDWCKLARFSGTVHDSLWLQMETKFLSGLCRIYKLVSLCGRDFDSLSVDTNVGFLQNLENFLLAHYPPSAVQAILHHFQQSYGTLLQSLSLDDIERISSNWPKS